MQVETSKKMSDAQLEESARLFGILSEPSRLRLLRLLMEGEFTVSEISARTGLKQGNTSKHLGVLRQAGFIGKCQEGNFVRYHLADPRVRALCELMCARIHEYTIENAARLTVKND